jgi:hypothetical protein
VGCGVSWSGYHIVTFIGEEEGIGRQSGRGEEGGGQGGDGGRGIGGRGGRGNVAGGEERNRERREEGIG